MEHCSLQSGKDLQQSLTTHCNKSTENKKNYKKIYNKGCIEIPGVVGDGVVTFAVAVGTKKGKKTFSL